MHIHYKDSPREAVLEAAIYIGAVDGDDAITIDSVAKQAGIESADVTAVFADREQILAAIPGYVSERKVGFLQETLDADPAYADLFSKLDTFSEAYYEYAEREPVLFRYLFEEKAYVFENEWQTLLAGKPSGNAALDMVYDNMAQIADSAGLEIGPDVCPQTLAKLSVGSWATIHGMAHLSVLGVLRHQHPVVRRFNLREVSKALIGTLFGLAETCTLPDYAPRMKRFREQMKDYDAALPSLPDVDGVEDLTALPQEEARAVALECAIQLAGRGGLQKVTIEHVAEYFGVSGVFMASLLDNDFVLRERVEQTTDSELSTRITYLIDRLPEGAPALDKLLCVAVAYFDYALRNPIRYSACIAAASGSVVPLSEGGEEQTEMGEAFGQLMRYSREAVRESGHEPEDRLIYIKNFTLWAGANGMCHLASVGEFRNVDVEEKWSLYYAVASIVFASFEYELVREPVK